MNSKNRYKKTTKTKMTFYLIFVIESLYMMPTILLIASGEVKLVIQGLKIHKLDTLSNSFVASTLFLETFILDFW